MNQQWFILTRPILRNHSSEGRRIPLSSTMPKSSLGTQLLAAARQIIFDRIRDNADNVPIDLKR
jgi:hypothetical protein